MKPKPQHYHEALDRCHLITTMIGNFLLDHAVFEHHKDLRKIIEEAHDRLYEAYQKIGIKCAFEEMK